jgi:error-prone DNA polymerase
MSYAELHCLSNFTFLRGASNPEELVIRAQQLGYAALALTDECSLAGIVRAHVAARERSFTLLVGSELTFDDGLRLVCLATSRRGYGALARLITQARRAAPKGRYRLTRADLAAGLEDCLLLWLPGVEPQAGEGAWLRERFPGRLWLAVELAATGADHARLAALLALAGQLDIPPVASGDVHLHLRRRRALQDTLTAIRLGTTVAQAGHALFPNGERSLRTLARLSALYPRELREATLEIAARCRFALDELRYEYPLDTVPPGMTPGTRLRRLVAQGERWRWSGGTPPAVRELLDRELALIAELGYEHYFLTVHDLVRFARGRGILCQGRGSAANSAVCYALGITAVDPARMNMLFERFISRERNEPPDIDVDFEHERREEVIQYLYERYGRERAALTAVVTRYRPKSARRDVCRALGLDPAQPLPAHAEALVGELIGFPRHLSQHPGGFVIARGPLAELVPVENAAMPARTVIQWDKDDLDELGLLKVDVLGLGMLAALRRALALVARRRGREFRLTDIPAEDPAVYAMISRADTVGVFQIESRAQMAMLPRLRPRCYYDLVIEVAIVRPGPIQGQMVHPYLRRRAGLEPVDYPGPAVRGVLERTLGVPIFQEQVMQLAIVAAGFTPGEADQLRRAMAAWRRHGSLESFEQRLITGMRARGYAAAFAQQVFRQIQGFGEYGFPESHAASFALLVYASAWLKCHEPAAFCCALLNSQPMGFYAPAQLVRDARGHGVIVHGVDVNASGVEATLEPVEEGPALRLGLNQVRDLAREAAGRLVAARVDGLYRDVGELARRAGLGRRELAALAAAGALAGLAGHRHRAAWEAHGITAPLPLVPVAGDPAGIPLLRTPGEGEDIVADYRALGLTLGRHPLALLRPRLVASGWLTAAEVAGLAAGARLRTGGLVLTRQQPGSARGVTFVTLEDETGQVNLVVWRQVAERQRRALREARLLGVSGRLQREGEVLHVIAERLEDRSAMLGALQVATREFH